MGLLPKGQAWWRRVRSARRITRNKQCGLVGRHGEPHAWQISLAHNGVLFLDELPEFHRDVLEACANRWKKAALSFRVAAGTMTFPANFMLVAAMNPCPCGFYGDPNVSVGARRT